MRHYDPFTTDDTRSRRRSLISVSLGPLEMSKRKRRQSGRCLCGSVRFRIAGPLRPTVIACHCRNCRRFSGGLFTVTAARKEHLVITKKGSLKWFKSSKHSKRGFCGKCGSSLFGGSDQWPFVSISAASLNEPTGLKLAVHSWTEESADYWSFDPKLPRRRGPSGLGGPPANLER